MGQGPIVLRPGFPLSDANVVSNVAVNEARRSDENIAAKINGKDIFPNEVTAQHLSTANASIYGNIKGGSLWINNGGVTITSNPGNTSPVTGLVMADSRLQLIKDSEAKVSLDGSTGDAVFSGTLTACVLNSADIQTGSIRVGSGGVIISNDGGTSGIYIGENQIYTKVGGTVTFHVDGATGVVSARKFQLIGSPDNSLDLTSGTHYLGTSVTIGPPGSDRTVGDNIRFFFQPEAPTSGMREGDLWTDSDDPNFTTRRYNGTNWTSQLISTYKTDDPPSNNPTPTGLTVTTNSNGTVNYKLEWAAYNQGAKKADMILLFWCKSASAPTVNDSCIAFNVNTTSPSYYIFEGVNGADTWSFAIAAARFTASGLQIGPLQSPTSNPNWRGITSGTPNYTANVGGQPATTVASGALAGANAVQPGGGVYVNASKNITTIDLTGINIYSSTQSGTPSKTRTQITGNGIAIYKEVSGVEQLKVQIDHTNGIAIHNKSDDTNPDIQSRLSFYNNSGVEVMSMFAPHSGTAAVIRSNGSSYGLYLNGGYGAKYTAKISLHGRDSADSTFIAYHAGKHWFYNSGLGPGTLRNIGKIELYDYFGQPTITAGSAPSEGQESDQPVGSLRLAIGGSLWYTYNDGGTARWTRVWSNQYHL